MRTARARDVARSLEELAGRLEAFDGLCPAVTFADIARHAGFLAHILEAHCTDGKRPPHIGRDVDAFRERVALWSAHVLKAKTPAELRAVLPFDPSTLER